MSEVLRFWCYEASNIRCVRESDYDAAQSELAALREELAECNKRKAWWADSAKTLDERLTAAEQRNLRHESNLRHFASCADVRRVGTLAMDYVAALTKPTEPGASE